LVRASRITYVGELGWEIYVAADFASHVFEALLKHGKQFDLKLVGLHAVDSLRSEKGYRHWGHDIGYMDNPVEAGLGFVCDVKKPVPFIGYDAFIAQKETGAKRRLIQFKLQNPEPLLYHNEPIFRNDRILGYTTSASYGHSLECAVAMGYLEHSEIIDKEFIDSGSYEIEVAGVKYSADASLRPFYDPKGQKISV